MKRLQTTLVFGVIFAAALGTVMVNDHAISAFIAPVQYESYSQGMMLSGHVEMIVHDSEGNIVQYSQGDNLITTIGGDCIANELFDSAGSVGACTSLGDWDFIAIGNGTANAAVGDAQMDGTGDGLACFACGDSNTVGEMARKQANVSFNTGGANTIVTLTNSLSPFDFVTANATTVTQSALFNANGSPNGNGESTAINGDILAIKDLAPAVTVADGDSLTVTWTVTINTN